MESLVVLTWAMTCTLYILPLISLPILFSRYVSWSVNDNTVILIMIILTINMYLYVHIESLKLSRILKHTPTIHQIRPAGVELTEKALYACYVSTKDMKLSFEWHWLEFKYDKSQIERKRNGILFWFIVAIFVCFIVCWTPYHVHRILFVVAKTLDFKGTKARDIQEILHLLSGIVL